MARAVDIELRDLSIESPAHFASSSSSSPFVPPGPSNGRAGSSSSKSNSNSNKSKGKKGSKGSRRPQQKMAGNYQHAGIEETHTVEPALYVQDDSDEEKDDDNKDYSMSSSMGFEESGDSMDSSSESDDVDKKVDMPKSGIFSKREKKAFFGFVAQYFSVGVIYGGIPATVYPVFLGYLNVPAYVYATVQVISMLPWSFKFFFGLINDTVPIMGLRRKPYMVIGWAICAAILLWLWQMPLPEPYWCLDSEGNYIKKKTLPDGSTEAAEPCNASAAESAGVYTVLLMLAALGYVIADVAADGLTTEYAKAEPIERRGSTQTTAYFTRTVGQACSSLFVGLCMNSKKYNGSFDWGLSFEQVCFCFSIPAAIMVPFTIAFVHEPRMIKAADAEKKNMRCGQYFAMCWELLKSKAFFFTILYCFLTPVIGGISTTAGSQVKINWAGVKNFQNQMFSLVGNLLFMLGLWLVKKKFLNTNWRKMIAVTIIFLNLVDGFFTTLTIFDVVRNQYFYLGETVLVEIPSAANFVVSTFVIVEMADDGNEGLVYGLMTTASNLGGPFARAIGNQLYRLFTPSLSNAENYIEDEPNFRMTVFMSFVLSYGFAFASLATLYFLPTQKADAQRRKQTWTRHPVYGIVTITMLSLAFIYSLTVNFLSMDPNTMCLQFAGGDGCKPKVTPLMNPPNITGTVP